MGRRTRARRILGKVWELPDTVRGPAWLPGREPTNLVWESRFRERSSGGFLELAPEFFRPELVREFPGQTRKFTFLACEFPRELSVWF